jgi:DNA-binding NarL/FixJ family response regulator
MTARPPPGLRVLLLEDDPRDAELVEHALLRADPACTVLRVESEATFARALEGFAPDVVLSDHAVAQFDALAALRMVRARRAEIPLLVVAGTFERTASACLRAGAADFIGKSDLSQLGPAIATALELRAPLRSLSQRQRQVLQLLAAGSTTREIARRLRVSVKTVETHRVQVLRRLGTRSLADLVRYAVRVGLVPME